MCPQQIIQKKMLSKMVLLLKPLLTVEAIKALKEENRSLILLRSFNTVKGCTDKKKLQQQETLAVNNNITNSLLYCYFFMFSLTLPLASYAITARPLPLPAN